MFFEWFLGEMNPKRIFWLFYYELLNDSTYLALQIYNYPKSDESDTYDE